MRVITPTTLIVAIDACRAERDDSLRERRRRSGLCAILAELASDGCDVTFGPCERHLAIKDAR